MFNPVSTYRFQFHKDFTLESLQKIIPYLKKLGIQTVYASPIFKSTPGSTHGYDGLDPHMINPEIGTLEKFNIIRNELKKENINWLQDIVPNHMAFHPENLWLMDVMEKGAQSVYASYFDMSLSSQLYRGPLMVPFLGGDFQDAVLKGEIKIKYIDGRLLLCYYDNHYPLSAASYSKILRADGIIPEQLDHLLNEEPVHDDREKYAIAWQGWLKRLKVIYNDERVKNFIDNNLNTVNENKEVISSIASEQNYRLCNWKETNEHINFRRFFTVNGLICLNIQDSKVFDDYHLLIKRLTENGSFQGLRVDHIDGLFNPEEYLHRLRKMAGDETYIVVEKILEPGEELAKEWPIEGNTGYDFLAMVNNLLTYKKNEPLFSQFYQQLVANNKAIGGQVLEKKSYILNHHMRGELENLLNLFTELNITDAQSIEKAGSENLKNALGEFLIHCPVYRFYINSLPVDENNYNAITNVLKSVREKHPSLKEATLLLENVFLKPDEDRRASVLMFLQRCMQFSGPLMAKGVEDTLMYTYNRFIGHNEVGDSPELFGIDIGAFHELMIKRQLNWPLTLNATSTHDTKRGEDVRARLNVLTALGEEWIQKVNEWMNINSSVKKDNAPDANDEYFIYQNLVGGFPMPGEEEDDFENRLQGYMQKALRESKRNSDWAEPNIEYETGVKDFITILLNKEGAFYKSFIEFHKKVAECGVINSLVQTTLKFTLPGVPDTYQGCELWDLSFVDPDNRRAADYKKREDWLDEMNDQNGGGYTDELIRDKFNGKIKLWLTKNLMELRRSAPYLFTDGSYVPLTAEGSYKENIFAFARKRQNNIYLVIVPLHIPVICKEQNTAPEKLDWKDTTVTLPDGTDGTWNNVLLNKEYNCDKRISIKDVFSFFPIAILKGNCKENERGAGVLMHISSLPSGFGTGDLGPETRVFANYLYSAHQKYWQMLPINPTGEGQGFSPYSAFSSTAGSPVLISPELLAEEGLLLKEEIEKYRLPLTGKADFKRAEAIRKDLFEIAWQRYRQGDYNELKNQLGAFNESASGWLNDFACYMVIKEENGNKPWYEWGKKYRHYEPGILRELTNSHGEKMEKIKWLQGIFDRQWMQLKKYCTTRGIRLIGDIPFYVSYDSADVWANPGFFSIDENGKRLGVAGVPPDLFSEDGQLWGMPVFNWNALKEDNYSWWIKRIKRNLELFDLLRLDHFRAFAAYWDVPAGESTAKNGKWIKGPGADFFNTVQAVLNDLPFIAEDLGDVDEAVYDLRDQFNLPGMKVLQFAFGDQMPASPHIPHNYSANFIVYTGTHDNNTTRGWYRMENNAVKKQTDVYFNFPQTEETITYNMCRLAFSSTGKIVILPLQDILNKDECSRMNIPSSTTNNWTWQLGKNELAGHEKLKQWTYLFNRGD